MTKEKVVKISKLLKSVNKNKTGIFKRNPELIVILPKIIADIIGDNRIHISEFIIAKVKGLISDNKGHPKITDRVFLRIPHNLSFPYKIIQDTRKYNKIKYLFINIDPLHQIVVEIGRGNSVYTEINTIFDTTSEELKRLGDKLPTIFSSGETPISRIHASL